jgi:hypothetical protein
MKKEILKEKCTVKPMEYESAPKCKRENLLIDLALLKHFF